MNFKTAETVREKNKKLIGKEYNGATINELILVPTDKELSEKFEKLYLRTLDGEKAISPFIGADVDIVAVFDKEKIERHNIFFYTSIFSLPQEFEVVDK